MTFKQTMKEEAVREIDTLVYDEHGNQSITPKGIATVSDLTETIINATLKEVEESLGEESKGWSKMRKVDEYYVDGYNTLHRKVKAKLLELRK